MACILLWSSTVRVHDSHAYGKMDVTRKRISRILELREILLSFHTGFNRVNAVVVCAILESISGLEPSVISEPRYLKLVTVSSFLLSTYFDLCVDATSVVCYQLGLLGTDLHAVGCGGFVKTLNYIFQFFFLNVVSKAEVGDCSASNADSAFIIFKDVCHDPFQKFVEEGG